ncbi:uncharacterized protein LOC108632298 isoform X5 [Ceratina calcarata]|uniref:Uncharacterized protein LOC108632298 isoform X5 n=1 Tax=Ceratina calcarata TaxID=156304 RepID=A0AAJ7JFI5_9HYME|nr:uncharacterized protein LOC108632298 isoform X5 [Ceratina calcarata]
MMNNSNNKETINLLDLLSDTDSDVSDLVFTPKKKKVKRKHRPGGMAKTRENNSCGCSKSDMRILSLWLAAVLITFWLITLSWLAVILYGEIKKMDNSIKSETPGRQTVQRQPRTDTNPHGQSISCARREWHAGYIGGVVYVVRVFVPSFVFYETTPIERELLERPSTRGERRNGSRSRDRLITEEVVTRYDSRSTSCSRVRQDR